MSKDKERPKLYIIHNEEYEDKNLENKDIIDSISEENYQELVSTYSKVIEKYKVKINQIKVMGEQYGELSSIYPNLMSGLDSKTRKCAYSFIDVNHPKSHKINMSNYEKVLCEYIEANFELLEHLYNTKIRPVEDERAEDDFYGGGELTKRALARNAIISSNEDGDQIIEIDFINSRFKERYCSDEPDSNLLEENNLIDLDEKKSNKED